MLTKKTEHRDAVTRWSLAASAFERWADRAWRAFTRLVVDRAGRVLPGLLLFAAALLLAVLFWTLLDAVWGDPGWEQQRDRRWDRSDPSRRRDAPFSTSDWALAAALPLFVMAALGGVWAASGRWRRWYWATVATTAIGTILNGLDAGTTIAATYSVALAAGIALLGWLLAWMGTRIEHSHTRETL